MKTSIRWGRNALAACAATLLSWTAAANGPAAPPKLPAIPTDWTKFENLPPVTVGNTQYEATCSAYPGTDPKFSFWAKRGKVNNVVVYFEGGGACWDNLTCTFPIGSGLPDPAPQFYMAAIPPAANPAAYDGIFKTDSANPVKDWSFVYIPYCSGDLHLGSAKKNYSNAGNPLLPATFDIQHRGFDNFMVVLDWMRNNFRSPQTILVAGSSAGGYGAAGNFPYLKETYPNAHMHVVADASQGVTTVAFDQGNPGRNSWNPQLAPWIYGTDSSWVPGPDILRYAAEYYPRVKVSQFTTNFDNVQIGFYGVMKQFYGPGGACPNPAVDWNQQMLSTLTAYVGNVNNFRHYVAGGTYHTLLRSPVFYTEASGGIKFADWMTGMLKSQGGTGGSGGLPWSNRACPTCLAPLSCP